MKYSILFFLAIINLVACDCDQPTQKNTNQFPENNQSKGNNQHNDGGSNTKADGVWKPQGPVFKANAWIDASNDWLNQLGIPLHSKESIVVNAANGGLGGGGGIDGALCSWANNHLGRQFHTWRSEAHMPDNGSVPNPLPAGEFAIFDTPFGWIYLAVGPMASAVNSLDEAKEKVGKLVKAMLEKAHQDRIKRIVLPAISTVIFAGDGKGFTKKEFIQGIYQAMSEAIDAFYEAYPNDDLQIIVNNWDKEFVQAVKGL